MNFEFPAGGGTICVSGAAYFDEVCIPWWTSIFIFKFPTNPSNNDAECFTEWHRPKNAFSLLNLNENEAEVSMTSLFTIVKIKPQVTTLRTFKNHFSNMLHAVYSICAGDMLHANWKLKTCCLVHSITDYSDWHNSWIDFLQVNSKMWGSEQLNKVTVSEHRTPSSLYMTNSLISQTTRAKLKKYGGSISRCHHSEWHIRYVCAFWAI